jgi:hypothetical protein
VKQMSNRNVESSNLVYRLYHDGVKPCIVQHDNVASILDPVLHIHRNRVVAETLKAILRLNIEEDTTLIKKLLMFLLSTQHNDGSWSEIHPRYNQPSALITSIVGEAFLLALQQKILTDELTSAVKKAKAFVIENEKKPGYFLKSTSYTADHLNVDAACGAFLALYGSLYSDEGCVQIAERTAEHVCKHQFTNGSFPYAIDKGSYSQLLNIPCIHYQGVTLYYLVKIQEIIQKNWVEKSLKSGVKWLGSVQRSDGHFDWSKSGLLFAYYLSGAYAFGFTSFMNASRFDDSYLKNAQLCIDVLKDNSTGLCLRWEKNTWPTIAYNIPTTLGTALIGGYPLKHRMFRFGYGMYRQMARRRYSSTVDDRLFHFVKRMFHMNTSTVEPFRNYPDLFMTSEVLDCLSNT